MLLRDLKSQEEKNDNRQLWIFFNYHVFETKVQTTGLIYSIYWNTMTCLYIQQTPHCGTGGNGTSPPQSFWCVAVFWNDFTFSGKPLIFLTRWGIFLGVVALLESCDVTNNGRHLGCHLGFYQALEITQVNTCTVRNGNFCALHEK